MSTEDFFSKIKGSLFRGKFSQAQVDGLTILLDATKGLPTNQRAYILATAYHETARTMQPIHEYGKRAYFDRYDKRLGNVNPGDGFKYRGRGYVQLTGFTNYVKAKKKLGIDFVAHPDKALEPRSAARIIVRGMTEGWFTGKKLSQYKTYRSMRRIVNGVDRADLIAGYAVSFEEAISTVGVALKPETTGKPIHKSTTNIAAATAAVSMAASASGDVKTMISNMGLDPKWLLLVVGLAAVGWIFRERIKKSYTDGI